MKSSQTPRNVAYALISAALGVWAFVQCQVETKEMFDPIIAACQDPSASASSDVLVPFEGRLGGFLVCLGTQFLHKVLQGQSAGFITWVTTMVVLLPLGILMNIESGRSGAKGPVRYPTAINLIGQAIGVSVSFPVIWVPSFLWGGSRDGAVPTDRSYAAVFLLPPGIAITYLLFHLDAATYEWTLAAGLILGPLGLPMLNLLLWSLKPKSPDAVSPMDVSRGAVASANCYLLVSLVAFAMWITVLIEILSTYGMNLEALWDGVWTNANGAVRFMVIDAVGLFGAGLCYVASVDLVHAVAATLASPIVGPGASVGLILWHHEKLREGKAKTELINAEKKIKYG